MTSVALPARRIEKLSRDVSLASIQSDVRAVADAGGSDPSIALGLMIDLQRELVTILDAWDPIEEKR